MNIRIQQLNPVIGDVKSNTAGIKKAVKSAGEDGIDLLILPELTVCGYPPMDLLERTSFLQEVFRANIDIIEATGETAVLFGSVTANPSDFGRKCHNSAILAKGGEKIDEIHKTLLPTYDVFDDLRYFEPNREFHCMELEGRKLGVTICEDIWYNENDIQYHTYEVNPAEELAEQGADVIINISASPYTKTKPSSRAKMLQNHARRLKLPILYANQVGANTELIFDGDSMAINSNTDIVARTPLFSEAHVDLTLHGREVQPSQNVREGAQVPEKMEHLFKALCFGLKDYLNKSDLTKGAVLGLSGGIDSALTACVAKEALGSEQVVGITMPSQFSTTGSVSDSEKLARNLGIALHELPIDDIYHSYEKTLEPLFGGTSFDTTEENLQTRTRSALLMAYSNKFGHMLLNTGNKSELATGYCTLYGDMAGGLAVIGDLYKTEVYALAYWLNDDFYGKEVIPTEILEKSPSAELRPDQQDTDTLPEYTMLDAVLEYYIEAQLSPAEIVDKGYDEQTVRRIADMVDQNEYKRFQAPPALKVSTKAFGSGRRWPVVKRRRY